MIASYKNLFIVILSCLLVQQVSALDTTDPNKAFVDTWQAQFQNKSFVTIKLDEQDDKLTGTISHSQIQLGNQGERISAEARDGQDSFSAAKLIGKVLHLTSKSADSQDATQYELELTRPGQAELRIVGFHTGETVPNPWTLHNPDAAVRPLSIKDKLANAAQIWMSGQTGNSAIAPTPQ